MIDPFMRALLEKAAALPRGAFATFVEPKAKAASEGAEPCVEIRRFDSTREAPIETDVAAKDLRALIQLGLFELDSATGDDPNLHYSYSHFVLVDDEAIRVRLGPELHSAFEEARIRNAVEASPSRGAQAPKRKPSL